MMLNVLTWPFRVAADLLGLLLSLAGSMIGLCIGFVICCLGVLLCLTGIGMIIGVPLMAVIYDLIKKYVYSQPENNGQIIVRNYENWDRIWGSEPWIERNQFRQRRSIIPFTDEYTGTTVFVSAQDFLPIKDL